MSNFNYLSPQFIDFSSPAEIQSEEFGEKYFEVDHENVEEIIEMFDASHENNSNPNLSQSLSDKFVNAEVVENEFEDVPLRRSLSVGHIPQEIYDSPVNENSLINAFNNLKLDSTKKMNIKKINAISQVLPSKLKNFPSTATRSASSATKSVINKRRSLSRDAIHKIRMSINEKQKRKISSESLNSHINQSNKFISLAEAIHRFQFATPKRFHSQSNRTEFSQTKNAAGINSTVPHSPMLATKNRNRSATYLGHEEQQQFEVNEAKKNQIKAYPVNYKALQPPAENKYKRRFTSTQPFNFSEAKYQRKTVSEESDEPYEFHARPVPKTTAPGTVPIVKKPPTPSKQSTSKINTTPFIKRKYKPETLPKVSEKGSDNKLTIETVELCYNGIPKVLKLKKTEVKPFSFEERNKKMQEKKEQKIKEALEKEKKAREFHARPIPSKVIGQHKKVESKFNKYLHDASSSSSFVSESAEENVPPENKPIFKARPAAVIHKKPFVPKKEGKPLTEIQEFNLNTNQRSKAREEFDKTVKDREQQFKEIKKVNENYLKKIEDQEIKKLRQQTVHKANPVKNFKPFEIHPSEKPLTSPVSPKISKRNKTISESEKTE